MLDQFQARYPTGNLISELLQIHQGKFVVRVSVQVEGITRSTGMAAAETIELAEDRARSRALMVLGIEPLTLATQPESFPLQSTVNELTTSGMTEPLPIGGLVHKHQNPSLVSITGLSDSIYPSVMSQMPSEASPPDSTNSVSLNTERLPLTATPSAQDSDTFSEDLRNTPTLDSSFEELPLPLDNVTQLGRRRPNRQDDILELERVVPEPEDLSDAIAQTDIELARLRWSPAAGRDYLIQTYGKRARKLLTQEELLEFLNYLKSQPTPRELLS
ncbi:MAG: hypothetical protein JOZ78_24365 [Chroococcidiopsidaceae cyanobacterium CP_BM_ER_R8_30]|nr:hypothetical protein [Chroococcidiopsidaceae cyanobacterium CP_BM_ER_R8_30]